MIELLTICGFETHEIESELPRIKRAFDRLGITATDIERGKQRIAKYYDIELQGIRKALGLCIKDVVNSVLAREDGKKKLINGFMAPGFDIIGSALVTKSNDVYVADVAALFQFVIGCIFDKLVPILEVAEQKWLKSGKVAHCGNVKTLAGLTVLDLIPRPDFITSSGELCDTAPKTLNLLNNFYEIPTCTYDTCHDREFTEFPDSKRLIELSARSIRHLVSKIQDVVGFKITDDMIWKVIDAKGEVNRELRNIQDLMETSDPIPLSPTHDALLHCVSTLALSIPELEKPKAVLNTIYNELLDRVEKGKGIVEKGAPRILSLLPHHFADPRWEHLPEELGIAMVTSENGFFPLHGNRYIDFNEEKPRDPYELISQGMESSLCQSTSARIAIMLEVCKRLHVDGVWDKYHVGCRINVGDALLLKDAITKELGIPVLLMEWEGFDPREYNEEQHGKRFELFKDAMITNKRRT